MGCPKTGRPLNRMYNYRITISLIIVYNFESFSFNVAQLIFLQLKKFKAHSFFARNSPRIDGFKIWDTLWQFLEVQMTCMKVSSMLCFRYYKGGTLRAQLCFIFECPSCGETQFSLSHDLHKAPLIKLVVAIGIK